MVTVEKTAAGVIVSEFDGTTWYPEIFDNRDDFVIHCHREGYDRAGIEFDVDDLFPQPKGDQQCASG